MNSKSRAALKIILPLLLAFAGCGRGRSRAELPPNWVWDQDQTIITPDTASRNLWNGWVASEGTIEASTRTPRLVLWAREVVSPTVHLTYSLEGQPVKLTVNNRLRKPHTLDPSPGPREVTFEAPLRRGMNLFDFHLGDRSRLRISRLSVGSAAPAEPRHLRQGESVTLFLPAGRGRIHWRGSGRLTVLTREGSSGRLETRSRAFRTRRLSRAIRQDISLSSSGIVTVSADSGNFDIARFNFREATKLPAPAPRRLVAKDPPIIILLADACQAEHLSVYGYPRRTSPNLELFARGAVVFENAYANASYTASSVRSLLTGQYPEKRGAGDLSVIQDNLPPRIPEYLKAKGYRTSLFSSAVLISPKFGFTAGIDDYHQFLGALDKTQERKIDLALFGAWLQQPGPVFSYVHFIEPHLPIVAPPPFRDMFRPPSLRPGPPPAERAIVKMNHSTSPLLRVTPEEVQEVIDDYDATIAYVDSEIGRALEEIKKAGLYEEALIVVLADHGEAMNEHGVWGHSRNVFEETTHIPLLVKFPASMGLKGRVRRLVQPTDLFPTLLEIFGEASGLPGTSLLEAIRNGEPDDTFAVSQAITEVGQFAARWGGWYYILSLNTGREQLFDLDGDPRKTASGEKADAVKSYMRARLLDWLKHTEENEELAGASIDLKKLSPAEIERLKSLGYL